MSVHVIKATKPQSSPTNSPAKLRVAAYARVSTSSDAQETSYESQCIYYTNYISTNPSWTFAGIYADEGISGTTTKNREEFNKMIEDCKAHKIDMIITKSISRWARNTIDSLQYIRLLKDLNITVLFEKENINTMDESGEFLITVMSSLAQQESGSISANVRMGIQYQMQQGKGRLNTTCFLGYAKEDDQLKIVPDEAVTIRRIYREYLEGFSPCMIANRLASDNILSPAGKPNWYQSTVVSILSNEKYCGDLLLQKYYVPDFLTHRVVKNEGQLPQYYIEDAHDPIIPKEVFYQVQGELQRRSVHNGKIRFGSGSSLKGRLVCGKCGNILKRYKKGKEIIWICKDRSYEAKGTNNQRDILTKCECRHITDFEIKDAIITVLNTLPERRDEILRLHAAVHDGEIKQIDQMIVSIDQRLKRMEEIYNEEKTEILNKEIESLEVERTSLILERAEFANKGIKLRILLELIGIMGGKGEADVDLPACKDYEDFFRRTTYKPKDGIMGIGKIRKFDDGLVVRCLDKVIVKEDRYEVHLKGGITGDVILLNYTSR